MCRGGGGVSGSFKTCIPCPRVNSPWVSYRARRPQVLPASRPPSPSPTNMSWPTSPRGSRPRDRRREPRDVGTARDHMPALLRARGFPNYGIYYESASFLRAGFQQPRRHTAALCRQPALEAGTGVGCRVPARGGGMETPSCVGALIRVAGRAQKRLCPWACWRHITARWFWKPVSTRGGPCGGCVPSGGIPGQRGTSFGTREPPARSDLRPDAGACLLATLKPPCLAPWRRESPSGGVCRRTGPQELVLPFILLQLETAEQDVVGW